MGTGAEDHTIDTLAKRAKQFRPRSTNWLKRSALGLLLVAVVTGLVIGGFVIADKATHHDAQLGLTSAKVISRVNDALSTDQAVSGTVTVDSGGSPVAAGSYAFTRSAEGSYRITANDGHWSEAYDAQTGALTTIGTPGTGPAVNMTQNGVAPGPPDVSDPTVQQLGDPMTGIIRVLAQGNNMKVTTLGDNGAPQYVLDADLPLIGGPGSGLGHFVGAGAFATTGGADHVRVVIDQSLQLPTDVQLTREQGSVMHLRIVDLAVGDSTGAGAFTVPGAAEAQVVDRGYEAVPLTSVAAAVGYQPLTPAYLPSGFTLAAAAVQPTPLAGQPTTAGGRNPPDQDVVVLTYRHGGESITLTTRRFTSASGRFWIDPLAATGTGDTHPVSLTAGAFLEVGAQAGDKPVAHLWGHDRNLVFTVTGTVSQQQLVKVASSLQ